MEPQCFFGKLDLADCFSAFAVTEEFRYFLTFKFEDARYTASAAWYSASAAPLAVVANCYPWYLLRSRAPAFATFVISTIFSWRLCHAPSYTANCISLAAYFSIAFRLPHISQFRYFLRSHAPAFAAFVISTIFSWRLCHAPSYTANCIPLAAYFSISASRSTWQN